MQQAQGHRKTLLQFFKFFEVVTGQAPQLSATVVQPANVATQRVVSFRVGDGALPDGPGEVMTTDDGDTVKVLPAAP